MDKAFEEKIDTLLNWVAAKEEHHDWVCDLYAKDANKPNKDEAKLMFFANSYAAQAIRDVMGEVYPVLEEMKGQKIDT